MAYNLQTSIPISFQTGEDLSNNQFMFVRLGSDGLLYHADSTTYALGVLTNQPSAAAQGQYAGTVDVVGVTRLCVDQAYPIGTWLVPGTDGTFTGIGMSVADASVVNSPASFIRARALQASTASYDIIAVKLVDSNPGADGTVVTGM